MILSQSASSQRKIEHIVIDWPGEYNWKIVQQGKSDEGMSTVIIPGNETVSTASIIGSLTVYKAAYFPNIDSIVINYKNRTDTGSTLTVIQTAPNGKYPWVIFKVETPKTDKYPEPESDLYYVVQGKYGLYENYVAIKKPMLSDDFVKRWTDVFKTSKIKIE